MAYFAGLDVSVNETSGDRRIVVSLKAAKIEAQDKLSDGLPRVGMDVEIDCPEIKTLVAKE